MKAIQEKHGMQETSYEDVLRLLTERVRAAQLKAALAVNRELVSLYWEIGREILVRQTESGWGAKLIDRLSADLRATFPEVKGFSVRNLKYMRSFAAAWPEQEVMERAPARIPWFHNCVILDKSKNSEERAFYVAQALENGWSRNVLNIQIESGLYHRQGRAITNFERTLPSPDSDLAQQTLKDPYVFDFLELTEKFRERDLEKALLQDICAFLLELGVGFSFVGSQYHLEVGGRDFYVDLLFYHLRLRRYVVIDLKAGEFLPEYAGKMNFYLSAVDDTLRSESDGPTIGLLLCKQKNKVIVEYALRETLKPIGVSEWQLTKSLPEALEQDLPTVDALTAELETLDTQESEVSDQADSELSEAGKAIYALLTADLDNGEVREAVVPYGGLDEPMEVLAGLIETALNHGDATRQSHARRDLHQRIRRLMRLRFGFQEASRRAQLLLDLFPIRRRLPDQRTRLWS